jgi:hypothetical protein
MPIATLDIEIVDPMVASPLHAAARQRRREYERNRHWQDSWAADCPGPNRYLDVMVALSKFGARCAPRLKDGRNC